MLQAPHLTEWIGSGIDVHITHPATLVVSTIELPVGTGDLIRLPGPAIVRVIAGTVEATGGPTYQVTERGHAQRSMSSGEQVRLIPMDVLANTKGDILLQNPGNEPAVVEAALIVRDMQRPAADVRDGPAFQDDGASESVLWTAEAFASESSRPVALDSAIIVTHARTGTAIERGEGRMEVVSIWLPSRARVSISEGGATVLVASETQDATLKHARSGDVLSVENGSLASVNLFILRFERAD